MSEQPPEAEHRFHRKIVTAPMKARASGGLRKLAADMNDAYPEMDVHQHLQDAARELDAGRTHSSQRHIHAAIFGLQPLQLRRHGVADDAGHMRGKAFMQQAHRHLLLVKDIEDVHGSNRAISQERAMRNQPPQQQQQALAASWEHHLHVIELVATPHHETAAGRKALAKKGQTAYGTSYPMPNTSYVHKALKAVGRVAPGKRGVLKRAIQKRAKQLGISHHLKGTWAEPGKAMANVPGGIDLAAYGIEDTWTKNIELAFRYSHGWVKLLDAGSAVPPAGGSAVPLEPRSSKVRKESAIYRKARALGHSHDKALAVVRAARRRQRPPGRLSRIAGGVGRALQAGSAVPPAGFANPSGPLPFVLAGARYSTP